MTSPDCIEQAAAGCHRIEALVHQVIALVRGAVAGVATYRRTGNPEPFLMWSVLVLRDDDDK